MRTRHTRWLVDLTSGLTTGLRGPDKLRWSHLANSELANLARAADWGLGDGDPVEALRIGVNLSWYSFLSANVQNDEPVMLALFDRSEKTPPELRCRALMWSGLLSIGRTVKRTWAMDAVDVARTASSAGTASSAATGVDGVGLTRDAIAFARTTDDPALLLEALSIGSMYFAASARSPRSCASSTKKPR